MDITPALTKIGIRINKDRKPGKIVQYDMMLCAGIIVCGVCVSCGKGSSERMKVKQGPGTANFAGIWN
jgi:hypothetical protein